MLENTASQMTPQFILNAIRGEVEKIVEEEAAAAQARVKERVARRAAEIAVSVMSQIQVDTYENQLVVRVGRR